MGEKINEMANEQEMVEYNKWKENKRIEGNFYKEYKFNDMLEVVRGNKYPKGLRLYFGGDSYDYEDCYNRVVAIYLVCQREDTHETVNVIADNVKLIKNLDFEY